VVLLMMKYHNFAAKGFNRIGDRCVIACRGYNNGSPGA